jgi:hypothetical protein
MTQLPFSTVDWSRYRLTRARIALICVVLLVIAAGVTWQQFSNAKKLMLQGGAVVGGDFIAFYSAAKAALASEAGKAYAVADFMAMLQEYSPAKDPVSLTWQYPPTYFFIVTPFGALDYVAAYALFALGTMAAYFGVLRARLPWFFILVIAASPTAFHALVTGQNGFLTATLLAIAALYPDKRPIVAGLAAALMTVKPQLGLLIPVAFAAAGCWRAFLVAALGSAALAGASVLVFGFDIWIAFIDGVAHAGDNLATGLMPLYKMATPYAAARLAGLPYEAALFAHCLFALAAAATVGIVWRNAKDGELKAATLVAAVFFAAPYGFYYELVILALPAALIAKRALASGWLRYEQAALALVFTLPMQLPGMATKTGLCLGFGVAALLAACVLRRVAHEEPDVFATPAAVFSSLRRAFLRRDNRALPRPERPATGA